MANYSSFDYGDGTLYGNPSLLAYSAAPFTATAETSATVTVEQNGKKFDVVHPQVLLKWSTPTGDLLGFRIVRNQEGYSEHEEDGQILYETFYVLDQSPAVPNFSQLLDQYQGQPLTPGKYAYYTIWVLRADKQWVTAASTYCLVPQEHALVSPDNLVLKNSVDRFVELLPKVFTTSQQSYLDEIDKSSDLYAFLGGFSYTLDEILTHADLLVPDYKAANINPNNIDAAADQLGLPKESVLSMQRKKALIRNAFNLHKNRGTLSSLGILTKSITGYSAGVSSSRNLFLNLQDSTFYLNHGSWVAGTNASISAVTSTPTYQGELYAVDKAWCGEVVTTGSNAGVTLGTDNPRLLGIPVMGNATYELSFYVAGDASNFTYSVTWYDWSGQVISTTTSDTDTVTGAWTRKTLAASLEFPMVSPSNAQFATVAINFASAGTYHLDMFQLTQITELLAGSPEFHEARAAEITLHPTKINLLENPSFTETVDVEDTDWSWSGVAVGGVDWSALTDAPGVYDGSHMLKLTTDGATPFELHSHTDEEYEEFKTGTYYTFSIYLRTDGGTEPLELNIAAYHPYTNEDGVREDELIYDENGAPVSNTLVIDGGVTDTWGRYQVTLYVPYNMDSTYLKVSVSTGTNNSNGNTICFDAAQVETGTRATDYFDGSYNTNNAFWFALENDSMSLQFRNKTPKVDRLISQINDFLPLNTAWIVQSGVSGMYTLEASGFSS